MKKIICKKCGKIIQGYSLDHCKYLLKRHNESKDGIHSEKKKKRITPTKK